MTPETFCDICNCPYIYSRESDIQVKREFLPGSEGCFSLNQELWVYFIATKLLKLQRENVLKQIVYDRAGESNITLLYSKMCTRCEIIVNEALELHSKVMMLQKKIDKLATTLMELNSNVIKRIDVGKRLTKPALSTLQDKRKTGDKDEASRQMLGLSMACLGKSKFPSKKSKNTLPPSRRLRNRKVEIPKENDSNKKLLEKSDADISGEEEAIVWNFEDEHIKMEVHAQKNSDADVVLGTAKPKQIIMETAESKSLRCQSDMENNVLGETSENESNEDSDMDYEPDHSESNNDDADDSDFTNSRPTKRKRVDNADDEKEGKTSDLIKDTVGNASDEQLSTSILNKNEILSKVADISKATTIDFQCTSCGRIFSNRQLLRTHALKIHGIEHFYTCPRCPNLKFSRRALMIEHRNKAHGSVCDKCGKELRDRKSLRVHMQLVHKMLLSFPCPLCKMVFKKSSQLVQHHRKFHVVSKSVLGKLPSRPPQTPEEREWLKMPCEICGKKYLSGTALENHLSGIHERRFPKKERKALKITCCFCSKSFYLKQRLTVHMKIHHVHEVNNASFPCEQCDENGNEDTVFHSCSQLLEHLQNVHAHAPVHKCIKCGWPFLNEAALKQHKKVHQWAKRLTEAQTAIRETFQFKCYFCWRAFPNEAKLKKHLDVPRHHPGLQPVFNCDVEDCEHQRRNSFTTVADLNQHLVAAHIDSSLIHHCSICSWGFVSPDMLELHELNHVHAINGRRACPRCDEFSASLQGLKSHYNLCHGKHLQLFKCEDCGKKFRLKHFLDKHVLENHQSFKNESTKIPCDQCGKLYPNEAKLKNHHFNCHQEHQCEDCGEVFQKFVQYCRHRKIAHGHGEKHLCSVCGKEFLNRGALSVHMNMHKEKKYKCHVCHIRMADLDNMKKHIERIHENSDKKKVEPSGDFVCQECGSRFSRKDSLDDHVRVNHTKETWRVWSCDNCGKRFKRSTHLTVHQKGKGCPGPMNTIIV